MRFLNISLVFVLISLSIGACKKPGTDKEDYNRTPMLTNIADNLIIPNYQDLQTKLTDLSSKINTLNLNATQINLDAARVSWFDAYKQWQHCKVYEVGPHANVALRNSMNTYPSDTVLINNNIISGSYTLGAIGNIQAIGFPALDYLLYFGTDANILSNIANTPNLQQYLTDLVAKMNTDVNFVSSEWTTSYRSTFIGANGTATGSSVNNLFNQLAFDLELIKNAKYGIPLGKDILDIPRPTYVEAYFSGYSNDLAIENMKSLENLFLGRSMAGVDGDGFAEYCDFVEAKRGAEDLSVVINNQFALLLTDLGALPNPLSSALNTDYNQINNVYFAVKTQVLYIKTDMSSALGLLIEYFDNDGD